MLSVDVSGATIEFDYGYMKNIVDAAAGTTQTDTATIVHEEGFFASEYNCTVTVTASGVCGEGGSEPACPTKTSDSVSLPVQCELWNDCLSSFLLLLSNIVYSYYNYISVLLRSQ